MRGESSSQRTVFPLRAVAPRRSGGRCGRCGWGPMQGTNPNYYGGQRVEMFGGLEYKTAALGTPVRVALEAGAPIYQNLNGPQMGKAWRVNLAAGVRF